MKKLITFLMLTACTITAIAQQYKVQCQVNDSEGEGVPYATVYIYNSNDTAKVIASDVSDAFGKVDHAIAKPGSYLMKIQFIGMATENRTFEVSSSSPVAQLGTIVLTTESTMLSEVVVSTQRQLVKTEIDRLSYDVQADADSKTSNVLDMLKKVPMVTVDGQDEIRVKGTTSFKVYRNGHPDPALASMNMKEILKVIPASMIKKIEVITDPGAKYDAEGTSAILNIVMADGNAGTMNGVTGTIGAGVDYADYSATNNRIITDSHYDWYYDTYYNYSETDVAADNHLEKTLKGVCTLKLGAEVKPVDNLALRLGYNYSSPMYEKNGYKDGTLESNASYISSATDYTNWKATNRITCGVGYNIDKFSVDLAYQYTTQKGDFRPFTEYKDDVDPELDINVDAKEVKNERHQLLLTLGYHF